MGIGYPAFIGTPPPKPDSGNRRNSRGGSPRVVFVLDRKATSYPAAEQFELAVSVAASMLELTIAKGMPIGFVSSGATSYWFGEGRSPVSRDEVLQHLVDVEADGTQSLGDQLCQVAERYEPGIHVVIIGSSTDEQTVKAMGALESKRMVPSVIHISDKHALSDQKSKFHQWQLLCQSKQWEFCTVSQLENLPQALGGVSA